MIENKPFLGLNDELCIGHSPEIINYFLDNPAAAKDFGEHGRQRVLDNFSFEKRMVSKSISTKEILGTLDFMESSRF